jgi:hypothetical protein
MWEVNWTIECEKCGLLRKETSAFRFVNIAAGLMIAHRAAGCWNPHHYDLDTEGY